MPQSGTNQPATVATGQSVIIVGANGAGKTRLGSWIEQKIENQHSNQRLSPVQRIAAQKSLKMPEYSRTSSIEIAEASLRIGIGESLLPDYIKRPEVYKKSNIRWGNNPITQLLNDYDQLMSYLFTDESETSINFRSSAIVGEVVRERPNTKLDTLKNIWQHILPHRELIIGAGEIKTKTRDAQQSTYNAAEMSDGERVVFYLIGQALAAPKDGTIIIDEPELHLHKSIQAKLWREIQNARPDCLFVYLTHDVEFAASLIEAKKIWLKSFNGQVWEWEEVPEVEGFPEELLLQVLGTRRPILFVEGDNGSLDVALFRFLYPEHTVIPRASCHEVIQSVGTLRALPQLHRLRIHGIIDRDRRTPAEIQNLQSKSVETLSVAEVENLFCVPGVLQILARQMNLPEETVTQAQDFIFQRLQGELENQISKHVANEVQYRLNTFNGKTQGQSNIESEVARVAQSIDVAALYSEVSEQFNQAIAKRDYLEVLRLYNQKSFAGEISGIFRLAKNDLPRHILRLTQGEYAAELRQAFGSYIPSLQD